MRVLVAGGGIGGLAAAVGLRKVGHEPIVLEQATRLGFVGQGIGVGANATKALRFLGAAEAVHQRAVPTVGWAYHSLDEGTLQMEIPIGDRFGGEQYISTHRADLLDALLAQVTPGDIRLGSRISAVGEDPDRVWVQLADGTRLDGDVLIGADGAKSIVRDTLLGTSPSTFSRFVAWRAAVPAESAPVAAQRRELRVFSGNAKFFVLYPIRDDLVNLSAYVPTTESAEESWSLEGDIERLHHVFAEGCDEVQLAIKSLDTVLLTGIHVRDPLQHWVTWRTALLGDAAHSMGPFSGNGGGIAIEDAVTLAILLEGVTTAEGLLRALRDYESRRQPRVNRLQTDSRARLSSLNDTDPLAPAIRAGIWAGTHRLDPLADHEFGWVYGHDPVTSALTPIDELHLGETVNRRRPEAQQAANTWAAAFGFADHFEGWRSRRRGFERFCSENFPAPDGLKVQETRIGDVPALVTGEPANDDRVVVHLHGGGYGMGSARGSLRLAARLGAAAGCQVVVPDYRLAPEHPFPAAPQDVAAVYRALRESAPHRHIIVTGEDAGGGLAIGLAVALRDSAEVLPAALFVVSPFADLTASSQSLRSTTPACDPFLTHALVTSFAAGYIQTADPTSTEVSPSRAGLSGLPPMLVAAARDEALSDDAVAVAKAESSALMLVDDSVHSFILFDYLPESAEAITRFAALVEESTSQGPAGVAG